MSVRLTPAEFTATRAKIAKINERATKRGFTGRFEVTGARIEVSETVESGLTVTSIYMDTEITGETPKYNGWTFLARVDAIGDTFTLATAPGVEHVDRDLVRAGHCDHCESNRYRKCTYLVQGEDGAVKNVGSTCIKDFLGWQGNFAFMSQDEADHEAFGSGHGGGEQTWTTDTVLAAAYAAIRAYGFTSTQGIGRSTADVVRLIIGATKASPKEREELHALRAYAEEATAKAAVVREWILSDAFEGRSTYVENLKAVVAAGEAAWAQLGLLASAPQAYIRHLETTAERQAREAGWAAEKAAKAALAANSHHIGNLKDKVQFKGTISAIRFITGTYGTTTLYTILTTEGNLVKWFASSEALGDKEGVEVHLIGTIKDFDEYEGTLSTIVTRCAKVNPDTGKPFSAQATGKHHHSEWVGEERVYAHATPHPHCEYCYNIKHFDHYLGANAPKA